MKKHLSEAQKKEYSYFLSLVSSVLNDTEPQLPYENCNLDNIRKIANDTRMDALFFEAIIMLSRKYSVLQNLLSYYKTKLNKLAYIDTLMKYEVENLLKCFDKEQIYNLPMKGYFLKKDYPNPFERSVSDFDILFDIKDIDKIKRVFTENGYSFVKNDDQQYHFKKAPFMYIEMHKSLLHDHEDCYSVFENQLKKAKVRDGYNYSKRMSLEDYYTYMIIHSANHFAQGGISVRMIADVYVFYKKYGEKLDKAYLKKLLKTCKMTTLEQKMRNIAFKWFSPDSKAADFNDLEEFILMSMGLGRLDVAVMSNIESQKSKNNNSKSKAVLSSVFPSINSMKYKYSYLEKCPILLPFSWACMWCRRIFIEKNVNVKRGLSNRLSYTDEDVKFYAKLTKEVGLDSYKYYDND